jgi:hypothetical protein
LYFFSCKKTLPDSKFSSDSSSCASGMFVLRLDPVFRALPEEFA